MSHFAYINDNNIVENVIVAEQDFINEGLLGDLSKWIQTSYNTKGGIHYQEDGQTPSLDQSKALRKNFAQPGMIYDSVRDAFYLPKPEKYPSWIFNEFSCIWEPPIPYPQDGKVYNWKEELVSWVEANIVIN